MLLAFNITALASANMIQWTDMKKFRWRNKVKYTSETFSHIFADV